MAVRLTVIGAGPGGYQAALAAARLGAQVTLVESSGLGGTCLHRGCIPTKALQASAAALLLARRLGEYGIKLEGALSPDLAAMMARKDQIVSLQAQGIEKLLAAAKVRLLAGRGWLKAPDLVGVELGAGGSQEVAGDRVILATGSRPLDLPGLARDGSRILNSDDALALKEMPASLAIVGGGVVGCELASILSALGSRVTLIEALERLLPIPSLDPEASKLLAREFRKQRLDLRLGTVVQGAAPTPQGLSLDLAPSPLVAPELAGQADRLSVDKVIVAVGRGLNSEGLGLSELGAQMDGRGAPKVDANLMTSLPGVYAVGDLLGPGRPMLAHMASAEGVAAAMHACGQAARLDYSLVPAAAFTFPEVAWVGLTLEQAQAQGQAAQAQAFPLRLLGKAQAMGEIAGQVKLISHPGSGRLLGAHIIGAHAADLVHEAALGIRLGAKVSDLAHAIHAHPTLSEGLKECAEAALGMCLHLPMGR